MKRLLLTYYGDDLTGSTDAMEALALHGVKTVLFTRIPGEAELSRFADHDAVGLAGASRSETPEWMEENLTPAFSWLRSLGDAICHYKVCSTFDSSPGTGNIGRAIEIGRKVFGQRVTPLVVGVPQLRRYTVFGNLFAAYQGTVYRIDRHPVMSRHPVTPMHEADLRIHLSRQTELVTELISIEDLQSSRANAIVDQRVRSSNGILMFDVDSFATQAEAGRQIWRKRNETGAFVAGSSGIEYALIKAWEQERLIPGRAAFASPDSVDRIAVVSGSVSPMTAHQIRRALADGFESIALDPLSFNAEGQANEIARGVRLGLEVLERGRSVILHTALGPDSDRGEEIRRAGTTRHAIGQGLGMILRQLIARAGLQRVVIAGGDTSSHALAKLGIMALTTLHPLPRTPGSPLCRAHGGLDGIDGLQIALKGGQLGGEDYFADIRDGRFSGQEVPHGP